ncbi:phosphatidylglycerophosphatase A [Nitrosomonas sp. JL21]|uniref:phosphatidylglycerophosphatase A family protein n=1 Tax=Nitrosomonas sp. JL21 TaxID=153949 RepID=UPI0013700520|nr:phosphatidylglycerophosphatase A [Nitrosomonas sp. JL21]MBL8496662.1 phosphatidylglycerophosphatase A [Nitrosomonas sp.]MCC7091027.1 phosphatidylglycerophosphatase A [Nitrosomonas sp.]MXS76424.1 phosphatidylglycerophosphatase A [Nitrosomonas sp. JL21]
MTTSMPETNNLPSTPTTLFRPTLALVYSHPAYLIAFSGGVGLIAIAPGTMGTLVALPLFWLLDQYLDPIPLLLLIDVMFIAGIWACGLSGKALGSPDHGSMVWDETVAFLLVLYFTPAHWAWQLAAFLLFRFFDIAKPQPIRYYDSRLRGGFGVMFDDMLAAFFTLLCLAGWKAWVPAGFFE